MWGAGSWWWLAPVVASLCAAATPEEAARRAAELLQQHKARQAITELQAVIRAHPGYFPAHSLLGVCYSQLGKPQQAQPYFEKAVALAPRSLAARINLGANLLALNQPDRAASEFETVLAAKPDHVNALVNLGNARLRGGKTEEALQVLERARKLAPGDVEVQLALADLQMRSGRGADAEVEALAQSEDAGVQLALGLLLQRNGRQSEAAACFERYAKADAEGLMALAEKSVNEGEYALALQLLDAAGSPQKASAGWHALKGYSHFKLEQPQPALEHLQQAVRLDPGNEDYYLELAEYLGVNNAVPTVVVVLETAARTMPASWKIRTALGVAYLMQSSFEKAEAVLRSLVEADARDETAQRLLADCYNRAQNWARLKDVAATLRKLAPGDASGWYYGAQAEYQLLEAHAAGASPETLRAYTERAVRLGPGDWRAQVLRGKLLLRAGRAEDAVSAFRKAVAANPEEPTPRYLLATTLRQTGATVESATEFAAFREARDQEKARKFRTLVVDIERRDTVSP